MDSGLRAFTTLVDTPASYVGQQALVPVVNAAETALVFSEIVSAVARTIYVDKEATGAGDGKSWADAFTTIQAARDSLPKIVAKDYVISCRAGTKKYGTADANILNKLHDTGEFVATITWVGRRVFNINTGNWGVVGARDSVDQLSIVDLDGVALDLFPAGNESYVIEPTPYRESVYFTRQIIANNENLIVRGEHYCEGDCEANAVAGRIVDTTADFSNVEIGDRVFYIDLNGAAGRCQNGEKVTVDDISGAGAGQISTNGALTPTTNWKYCIVKTELSGSTDGTRPGRSLNDLFDMFDQYGITVRGFYITLSSSYGIHWSGNCHNEWTTPYNYHSADFCILEEHSTSALRSESHSYNPCYMCYAHGDNQALDTTTSILKLNYGMLDTGAAGSCFRVSNESRGQTKWVYYASGSVGVYINNVSWIECNLGTISNAITTGLYARRNACTVSVNTTNNAAVPVDPVGTVDNPYHS